MGAKLDVEDYSQYHGPALAALSGGFSAVSAMMSEKVDRRRPNSKAYQVGRAITGAGLGFVAYLMCQQLSVGMGWTSICIYLVGAYNIKIIDLVWLIIKKNAQSFIDRIKGYDDKN